MCLCRETGEAFESRLPTLLRSVSRLSYVNFIQIHSQLNDASTLTLIYDLLGSCQVLPLELEW